MGMPGHIQVEITTDFDPENNSVTRRLRFFGGEELDSVAEIAAANLGDFENWDMNHEILRDTSDFEDGLYKLVHVRVWDGYGNYSHKWEVI